MPKRVLLSISVSSRISWGLPLESLADIGKAMPWVGLLHMLYVSIHSACQNIKAVVEHSWIKSVRK